MRFANIKSFTAGLLVGIFGITSVFASGIIKSAEYTDTKFMINGEEIRLNNPFVSILKSGEKDSSLYMPVREVLQKLGYSVQWYEKNNSVDITTSNNNFNIDENKLNSLDSNRVIDLKNRNTFNMSESGNFKAGDNQILTLEINSNLINGTVDFILFNPNGEQQELINIGKMNETRTINLSKGQWSYNCSGMFSGGGNCSIIGILK